MPWINRRTNAQPRPSRHSTHTMTVDSQGTASDCVRSNGVALRPFTEQDFDAIVGAVDSARAKYQWTGVLEFSHPIDCAQLKRHLDFSARKFPGQRYSHRLYTAVNRQAESIGHIELVGISPGNLSATMSRVLVYPRYRGQGYAALMVQGALNIAFTELRLRRVELRVFSFNQAAIRCYEKAGFSREGLLRRATKAGDEIWDVVLMGILREEWTGIPSRRIASSDAT